MQPVDLLAAAALDALLGDPEWFPHPVRGVGRLIGGLETLTRRAWRNERLAGTVTILLAIAVTAGTVWATLAAARALSPWAERALGILWVYFGLSARCLSDEALRVDRDLRRGDLGAARRSVARIVGRDTQSLDASGVSRAAIESVAENTVDGILTPLFFAGLAGPVGIWVFKAISTGDSMIGHRDERYRRFGTVAARLDDVANFIPARLAPPLFALAALATGRSAAGAWRVGWRDRHHHDSPNAGIPEAAMAGALSIRLGGPATYEGESIEHAPFGAEFAPPEPRHIRPAVAVLWGASAAAVALAAGAAHFVRLATTPG